jgi:hypothetical protein
MDEHDFEAAMEEYKTLRQECLSVYEQRTLPLVYMSLVMVTLAAAAVQTGEIVLCSFLLSAVFPVALHWIGKRATVARIAYYIATELEGRLGGLRWESWVWRARGGKLDDLHAWVVASGVVYFYVLVGLGGAVFYAVHTLSQFAVVMCWYNGILAVILVLFTHYASGARYKLTDRPAPLAVAATNTNGDQTAGRAETSNTEDVASGSGS